ncbi:hypothetical protein [uncultured Gammaproteobacteria bacterium]|nr:hypothetical protein [uncultured Gammaproteobacteria bacterium]
MISKMTSFAELVKNGVLMIIHIYAKVSNIDNEQNSIFASVPITPHFSASCCKSMLPAILI